MSRSSSPSYIIIRNQPSLSEVSLPQYTPTTSSSNSPTENRTTGSVVSDHQSLSDTDNDGVVWWHDCLGSMIDAGQSIVTRFYPTKQLNPEHPGYICSQDDSKAYKRYRQSLDEGFGFGVRRNSKTDSIDDNVSAPTSSNGSPRKLSPVVQPLKDLSAGNHNNPYWKDVFKPGGNCFTDQELAAGLSHDEERPLLYGPEARKSRI